jgi:hypothetical protein
MDLKEVGDESHDLEGVVDEGLVVDDHTLDSIAGAHHHSPQQEINDDVIYDHQA